MPEKKSISAEQFQSAVNSLSEERIDSLIDGLVETGLGLSKKEKKAVEFVFWMTARIEKFVGRGVQEVLGTDERIGQYVNPAQRALRNEVLEQVTDDLFLLGKADILGKVIAQTTGQKNKEVSSFLTKINGLRNSICHNRYKNLMYDEQPLTSIETRRKLIADFRTIFKDVLKVKK